MNHTDMKWKQERALVDLSDEMGLLRLAGPDTRKLLQGQFTCDINALSPGNGLMGAHCQPQGRIISLFYLFHIDEIFYLFLPTEMLSIAQDFLKKYAVFYKTAIDRVNGEMKTFGYQGPKPPLLSQGMPLCVTALPVSPPRWLITGAAPIMREFQTSLAATIRVITPAEWKRKDIHDGLPMIYPATSGKFLPHELNLLNLHAVSLSKGCYTGQEIIARMQYRGKLKNHLYRVRLGHVAKPGDEINPSGTIVDAIANEYNGCDALIVTNEESAISLCANTLIK